MDMGWDSKIDVALTDACGQMDFEDLRCQTSGHTNGRTHPDALGKESMASDRRDALL